MSNKSAVLIQTEEFSEEWTEPFNLEELEEKLQRQLEEDIADIEFLKDEKDKLGNPEIIGDIIKDVVWEKFMDQIAAVAGADFIKANNNLTLDLRSEAHIQTTENFKNGKIATHNTKINYQERYDDWQANFQRDENGKIKTYTDRAGEEQGILNNDARKPFDKGRPTGSVKEGKDVDHIISVAEIIRDEVSQAHLSKEEQVAFANSDPNLYKMKSSWNRSKGDKPMRTWLFFPNSKGQTAVQRFDMSQEKVDDLLKKDDVAREEYEKWKKEGEKRSIETGKQSQREEAFRIGGATLRTIVMQLFAGLVKEIIGKLVKWFKSSDKKFRTLVENIKEAIHGFVTNVKQHVITAGNAIFSTIANSIANPILRTIKRFWSILKQGVRAVKQAIQYIKNPANKGKPIGTLLVEVGKIIIAGLTGVGGLMLGEVIEKLLSGIPILAVEIPLLGSLASLTGILMGGIIAGIIGALAINLLDRIMFKKKRDELQDSVLTKGNEIIAKQHQIQVIQEVLLEGQKEKFQSNISTRHQEAATIMNESYDHVMEDFVSDFSQESDMLIMDTDYLRVNQEIENIGSDLDDLMFN